MEVAVSKGLPVLKYHLLPRTKGFTTAVQCLRGTGKGPVPASGTPPCPGLRAKPERETVKTYTSQSHVSLGSERETPVSGVDML